MGEEDEHEEAEEPVKLSSSMVYKSNKSNQINRIWCGGHTSAWSEAKRQKIKKNPVNDRSSDPTTMNWYNVPYLVSGSVAKWLRRHV